MIFTRSRLSVWALGLAALFAVFSSLVPRAELMTILNGIFLGVVVAALIVYSPIILLTFSNKRLDRVSQLSLGIGLLFLSNAGQRLYWIVWHVSGSPIGWQSNPFLQAMAFLAIIGGCLFVTAPGYPPDSSLEAVALWGANRRMLIILGGLGGILTFGLSVWSGNGF